MDKKDRSKIIAVKLDEVLLELSAERQEAGTKELQNYIDKTKLQSLVDKMNELNEQQEELRATIESLCKKVKVQIADGHIELDTCYNGRSEYKYTLRSVIRGECREVIVASDVMTHLTRHRNSDNERLAKVVHEAMALLLEDDHERMEQFLKL